MIVCRQIYNCILGAFWKKALLRIVYCFGPWQCRDGMRLADDTEGTVSSHLHRRLPVPDPWPRSTGQNWFPKVPQLLQDFLLLSVSWSFIVIFSTVYLCLFVLLNTYGTISIWGFRYVSNPEIFQWPFLQFLGISHTLSIHCHWSSC